jgi:uncharacterized membrane protein
MTLVLLAAFMLGVASGLRAFTAPAVLFLMRGIGIVSIVLGVAALVEYAFDMHPKAPPRTAFPSPIVRLLCGALVGWTIAGDAYVAGAVLGLAGAALGLYGGLPVRLALIARIGAIPAALLGDVAAIGIALFAVTRIP